jgi:hypothetical protein
MMQNKKCRKGTNNPQTGKCWITNGVDSKTVFENETSSYFNTGWFKGRTIIKPTIII